MGLFDFIRGKKTDPNACAGVGDPRYVADHRFPLRAWAHGVMSIYVGKCADPGLHAAAWNQSVLQNNWSTPGPDELRQLLASYEQGEIGLAFDQARIVRLARHGWGAGWLGDDECWRRIAAAQRALVARYGDWESFIADFRTERARWWTEIGNQEMPDDDRALMELCLAEARSLVLPTVPMN